MERKCALTIICIVSTILTFPHGAKSKPGNVNVDVKVNVNGKKVIDESHPKKPDGECPWKDMDGKCIDHCFGGFAVGTTEHGESMCMCNGDQCNKDPCEKCRAASEANGKESWGCPCPDVE